MVGFQDRHRDPVYLNFLKKRKDDKDSTKMVWKYGDRNVEELLPFTLLIGGKISSYTIREINDETVEKLHELKKDVEESIEHSVIGTPTEEDVKRLREHAEMTAFHLFIAPTREDIDGYHGGG